MDLPSIMEFLERLVAEVAGRWGLDPEPLRNRLISLVNRMAGATRAELIEALVRRAHDHRDGVLRPILRDLYRWVQLRAAYLGDRLDDAMGEATLDVLRYWKASWAGPDGQQHLRAYFLRTVRQRAVKTARATQAHTRHVEVMVPPPPAVDPETASVEDQEAREYAIALSKLRDLDWRALHLTPAQSEAVVRWLLCGRSFDGLTSNEIDAIKKALQRARNNLRGKVEELKRDRRRHRRLPAGYTVLVLRHGQSLELTVTDESIGGIGVEAALGSAALEPGADYLVRRNSADSVLVRGARCVRVERTPGGFRYGLKFHFQHPLQPPVRRARRPQLSP